MQPQLPEHERLSISALASVFNHTASSYKFYWFLGILAHYEQNEAKNVFPKEDIVIEMLGLAWYPSTTCRLSFGKSDQLNTIVDSLKQMIPEPQTRKRREVVDFIRKHKEDPRIRRELNKLLLLVPYRFLTPWFATELRGTKDAERNTRIEQLAFETHRPYPDVSPCLYLFDGDSIVVHPKWHHYLLGHCNILQAFTYWHLIQYLQKRNPNVPNIPDKLFPPEKRFLLSAKRFWTAFLKTRDFHCIYSGERVTAEALSIDHFIPWSFVTHDQLWNLLPTIRQINSSKGDCLPASLYYPAFARLQYDAFHFAVSGNHKVLEDYTVLFQNDISSVAQLNRLRFSEILENNLRPLAQIAGNMGFAKEWQYKPAD